MLSDRFLNHQAYRQPQLYYTRKPCKEHVFKLEVLWIISIYMLIERDQIREQDVTTASHPSYQTS